MSRKARNIHYIFFKSSPLLLILLREIDKLFSFEMNFPLGANILNGSSTLAAGLEPETCDTPAAGGRAQNRGHCGGPREEPETQDTVSAVARA